MAAALVVDITVEDPVVVQIGTVEDLLVVIPVSVVEILVVAAAQAIGEII
jgi:hypothetical protein